MSGIFDNLANPTRFRTLSAVLRPICFWSALVCFSYGLYLSLVGSPADYQQGEAVRIMYVHVPSAWLGLSSYLGLGLCALFYLVWRHPLADVAARAIAPIGAGFTALTLLTGSLWGYPIWGTWWVWDARLTSMLVLLFFFIGYIALATGFDRPERGARMAAILALVGCVNLPIVKFSVDWWNTLHQPASILRSGGLAIDPSMLWPLFTMFGGFQLFFIWIVLHRMNWILAHRRALATAVREKGA
ncbi:MAG TPA: heme transporter HemC [Alphaproteobacteria bacterium]|nr:heme transporter HemC [Alphaproteobacteria bacterium]